VLGDFVSVLGKERWRLLGAGVSLKVNDIAFEALTETEGFSKTD
jgi:hypothetical protein